MFIVFYHSNRNLTRNKEAGSTGTFRLPLRMHWSKMTTEGTVRRKTEPVRHNIHAGRQAEETQATSAPDTQELCEFQDSHHPHGQLQQELGSQEVFCNDGDGSSECHGRAGTR